ncbi:hypothetical protein J6590_026220 [Homalodisca vitripennis]|nr:hypothetical protein J6590_026220 [Homalodisca vitripennis]
MGLKINQLGAQGGALTSNMQYTSQSTTVSMLTSGSASLTSAAPPHGIQFTGIKHQIYSTVYRSKHNSLHVDFCQIASLTPAAPSPPTPWPTMYWYKAPIIIYSLQVKPQQSPSLLLAVPASHLQPHSPNHMEYNVQFTGQSTTVSMLTSARVPASHLQPHSPNHMEYNVQFTGQSTTVSMLTSGSASLTSAAPPPWNTMYRLKHNSLHVDLWQGASLTSAAPLPPPLGYPACSPQFSFITEFRLPITHSVAILTDRRAHTSLIHCRQFIVAFVKHLTTCDV